MMDVKIAENLGYCSGVSHAIKYAQEYGDVHKAVYSLGTVAHNEDVVALLKRHGVEPVKESELKEGMKVIITAHGAPPELYERLIHLGCQSLDCTCPIVKKAQTVVRDLAASEFDIVIFGDPDHQEVKGLVGWSMGRCKFVGNQQQLFTEEQEHKMLALGPKVGVVSQTTKNPADYRDFLSTLLWWHIDKSPDVRITNTICPIVAKRIEDTRGLAAEVDMMFVVGSQESANTRNLCRVAISAMGLKPVFLVLRDGDIQTALTQVQPNVPWGDCVAGVTAGTSTPIEVVEKVVARLKEF
jgi:(E)-4-hydroxy-3-methyl-but-2-enyl pyrophosphate reductase